MNKLIKRFFYIASILAVTFTAGCTDDLPEEITQLQVDRLFSPTDIEAMIIERTSIRLSWKAVNKAESYIVEFFENADLNFEGQAFKTISNVTYDQLPILVTGFVGETTYSIRVKAVGEEISESKWTSTTATTGTEQIMQKVVLQDIAATTAKLKWVPNEVATTIVLNPGNIVHTVTAAEIAAGEATVTGLSGLTKYTATLMYGEKVRGSQSFETNIDLTDPAVTVVEPGSDLIALFEAATAGQRFALKPGTYEVAFSINITVTIDIVGAYAYDKPVINGAVLRLNAAAGLWMKNLILDGVTSDGNQTVVYNQAIADQTYGALLIEDCVIRNYTKGIVYGSNAVLVESVTYRGNIIHDVICDGGDFIDFRSGMPKKVDFINNTVYNCAANRDFFRLDNATSFSADNNCVVTIENNTFYKIINTEATTRRFLYIRLANHQIYVNKNIFVDVLGNYSNQSATTVGGMSSNNYFNAPNLIDATFTVYDAGSYTTLDPGFVNPDNADFTVTNQELTIYGIGDPRWIP